MNVFYGHVRDAIDYALSDKRAILFVGTLVLVSSLINKIDFLHPIWKIVNISMFFVVGYGSYISWFTLNGSNKHPDIHNYKKNNVGRHQEVHYHFHLFYGAYILFISLQMQYCTRQLPVFTDFCSIICHYISAFDWRSIQPLPE